MTATTWISASVNGSLSVCAQERKQFCIHRSASSTPNTTGHRRDDLCLLLFAWSQHLGTQVTEQQLAVCARHCAENDQAVVAQGLQSERKMRDREAGRTRRQGQQDPHFGGMHEMQRDRAASRLESRERRGRCGDGAEPVFADELRQRQAQGWALGPRTEPLLRPQQRECASKGCVSL